MVGCRGRPYQCRNYDVDYADGNSRALPSPSQRLTSPISPESITRRSSDMAGKKRDQTPWRKNNLGYSGARDASWGEGREAGEERSARIRVAQGGEWDRRWELGLGEWGSEGLP